ncbi:hypothetical protein PROFUN_13886 [Planoprotostelium fungivorum]|uniref:Uncharacterized protein n=1 Tax=Planoprotostelium fungivorum TaxID=1890364 RepID=A0A2P6N289_9EUKA|nr:hypothetical protein PROFUN_13886 [Planoprotostelium fungivorum]
MTRLDFLFFPLSLSDQPVCFCQVSGTLIQTKTTLLNLQKCRGGERSVPPTSGRISHNRRGGAKEGATPLSVRKEVDPSRVIVAQYIGRRRRMPPELLNSMTLCCPKHPASHDRTQIVHRSDTDTHNQVQEIVEEALKHIGRVIRNSEVQMHVPILLEGSIDPDIYTGETPWRHTLTNFVHSIDGFFVVGLIIHRGRWTSHPRRGEDRFSGLILDNIKSNVGSVECRSKSISLPSTSPDSKISPLRCSASRVTQSLTSERVLSRMRPTTTSQMSSDNTRFTFKMQGNTWYSWKGEGGQENKDTGENPRSTLQIPSTRFGFDKRNKIIAVLYLIRNDMSLVVRQKAFLVWKKVIQNAPKALFVNLMRIVIDCLGSTLFDKRQVSKRMFRNWETTFSLRSILYLGEGFRFTRQVTCDCTPVPSLPCAARDESEDVREAAIQVFDTLYRFVGQKVFDEIPPPLLDF